MTHTPVSSPAFPAVRPPVCYHCLQVFQAAIVDLGWLDAVPWSTCDASGTLPHQTCGKPGRCFLFCFISCPQRVSASLTACCLTRLLHLGYFCLCSRMATLFLRFGRCFAVRRNVAHLASRLRFVVIGWWCSCQNSVFIVSDARFQSRG